MAKYGEPARSTPPANSDDARSAADQARKENIRKAFNARNAETEHAQDLAESGERKIPRPPIENDPGVAAARERALRKEEAKKPPSERPPVDPIKAEKAAAESARAQFMLRIDRLTEDAAQNIMAELSRQSENERKTGQPGPVTALLEKVNADTAGLDIPKIRAATVLLTIPRPAAEAILDKLGVPK